MIKRARLPIRITYKKIFDIIVVSFLSKQRINTKGTVKHSSSLKVSVFDSGIVVMIIFMVNHMGKLYTCVFKKFV